MQKEQLNRLRLHTNAHLIRIIHQSMECASVQVDSWSLCHFWSILPHTSYSRLDSPQIATPPPYPARSRAGWPAAAFDSIATASAAIRAESNGKPLIYLAFLAYNCPFPTHNENCMEDKCRELPILIPDFSTLRDPHPLFTVMR
jgi:hypothetical protein